MRWSGQQVLDDGVGPDLALPGLRGLLRSVRVPEFAGTTFHEVEAKSVLNRVPGDSPVPFRWTVNPYRGCGHACVYCLAGPTRVLLADGRTRPIADLRIGDAVVGTAPGAGHGGEGARRYVRTTVLAHWSTAKPAYRLTLTDGTGVVASGEHRFLTGRGWRHLTGGWCRSGRRPHLRPGDVLLGPGALPVAREHPGSYREGYLYGLFRADAAAEVVRDGRIDLSFPSARIELEALGRAHHFLAAAPAAPRLVAVGAGSIGARAGIPPIEHAARRPRDPDDDWCAGFLGGVADAAGGSAGGVLNLTVPDDELLGLAAGALYRLGFAFAVEPVSASHVGGAGRRARLLRIGGGSRELHRFLGVADPAVSRLRDLADAPVSGDAGLEVVDVRPLGTTVPMFDITTGTGDFVAEGAISHNCFARNTHTYLDLDAGADFDRQIVVKVNVARVLDREVRAPRWRREPVAMGTNTDPYQRAEGRYRLMPGIIDALARSGTPFSILTKGTVLGRDLPRLSAAAVDVPVGLGVSIALLDRALQARLEPGTPSPAARLDLVRRITDAGLPCGVMVAPVLPLLTDSAEALDALLARIAAAGATGASVLALHLRPGTREWFLEWLAREHPALIEPYARLYRRGKYVDPEYRRALAERVTPLLRRHGLTGEVTPLQDFRQPRGPVTGAPQDQNAPGGAAQLSLL
jgi:DNA repair photolyase